jgi:general secretion pathway protein G
MELAIAILIVSMQLKQKNKRGFSLIELLVVISIIGVLAAVLTANFMGMRERSRDAQKIQDLNSIKTALRLYYNDHQTYPGVTDNVPYNLVSDIGSTYLPAISSIGYTYTYTRTGGGDGFILQVNLEVDSGTDDTNSQLKCGIDTASTKPSVFMVCAN